MVRNFTALRSWYHLFALAILCVLIAGGSALLAATKDAEQHALKGPITNSDTIRWTKIGDPGSLFANDRGAPLGSWAPDRSAIAVVARSGNPGTGTNDADLLLFDTEELFHHPKPKVIAHFSTTENAQPIAYVRWSLDSNSIVFVGTQGMGPSQVFRVTRDGLHLAQITAGHQPLRWFDATPSLKYIFTAREVPLPGGRKQECVEVGCRVTEDTFYNQLSAEGGLPDYFIRFDNLTRTDLANKSESSVKTPDSIDRNLSDCYYEFSGDISPDGNYGLAICKSRRDKWPNWWRDYTVIPGLKDLLPAGDNSTLYQLVLLDYGNHRSERLTDAPYPINNLGPQTAPRWIDDGRGLIVAGALEPLSIADPSEKSLRRSRYAIELYEPRNRQGRRIALLDAIAKRIVQVKWDQNRQILAVLAEDGGGRKLPEYLYQRSSSNEWRQVPSAQRPATFLASPADVPTLALRQSKDTPPSLYVDDGKRQSLLLEINGWLADRELGRVEVIDWKSKDGRVWHGDLYLPPHYVPGHRYPLVIQTHGDQSGEFSLTGVTSNFAARPLAARGLVVLQLTENLDGIKGLQVWPALQQGYETAIDHLYKLGIVDRNRVGLIGWSWTGPAIGYAITHSHYDFSAVALINTRNWSWWWYMMMGGHDPDAQEDVLPYRRGFDIWMRMSPGFAFDRVRSAVLLANNGNLTLWDWYAALRQLHKPVEYWHFLDGQHELYRVPERLRWNELGVDWFDFWLNGHEDPGSIKVEQYRRWEQLCDMQKSGSPGSQPACVQTRH